MSHLALDNTVELDGSSGPNGLRFGRSNLHQQGTISSSWQPRRFYTRKTSWKSCWLRKQVNQSIDRTKGLSPLPSINQSINRATNRTNTPKSIKAEHLHFPLSQSPKWHVNQNPLSVFLMAKIFIFRKHSYEKTYLGLVESKRPADPLLLEAPLLLTLPRSGRWSAKPTRTGQSWWSSSLNETDGRKKSAEMEMKKTWKFGEKGFSFDLSSSSLPFSIFKGQRPFFTVFRTQMTSLGGWGLWSVTPGGAAKVIE